MWRKTDFIVFLFLVSGSVQLEVRLMPATNRFEVSENGNLSVSGEFLQTYCFEMMWLEMYGK